LWSFQQSIKQRLTITDNAMSEQRKMFRDEAKLTMDMYQVEQQLRLNERIPPFEEYWNYREGSSCIRMAVALIEYVLCVAITTPTAKNVQIRQSAAHT
jgi:hypothetical protein